MSFVGVGNATAGIVIANTLESVFTIEENKAATKGDLKIVIENILGRYHLVKNSLPNVNGEYLYYDLVNQEIVYFKNLIRLIRENSLPNLQHNKDFNQQF